MAGMGGAVFPSLGIAKQRADPLDPLLSQAQGEAAHPSPGAGSRCASGAGHPGDIAPGTSPPAPDTCCHPSGGEAASASLFTRLLPAGSSFPAGFCTLHMEGQAVPPPRVTGASRSVSSASNTIFWRF